MTPSSRTVMCYDRDGKMVDTFGAREPLPKRIWVPVKGKGVEVSEYERVDPVLERGPVCYREVVA